MREQVGRALQNAIGELSSALASLSAGWHEAGRHRWLGERIANAQAHTSHARRMSNTYGEFLREGDTAVIPSEPIDESAQVICPPDADGGKGGEA